MSHLTIALDIMGGDHGPHITLPATVNALHIYPDIQFILCGDKQVIENYFSRYDIHADNYRIEHCDQAVEMDDKPSKVLRAKRNSSMYRMLELVRDKKANGCVSAGNTGALMAMSYMVLKTLPGIDRPALISSLPTAQHKKVFLLDLGANVSCDAETLFQFAVMGSVLAAEETDNPNPRVALLNVGSEQIKGNETVRYASKLLSDVPSLNYIGFVEGNDIFNDVTDVVVTDGFVGNIALKSVEGLGKLVVNELKRVSEKNLMTRIMAKIALPLFKKIYNRVNPDQYNGASLIGLRGTVVKSHGNAKSDAFFYAIKEALQEVNRQVPKKIQEKMETVLMERP
ncbi:phosphate acyltransferase PlsX [Aestuariibacter sp. AA17]|uniref:Phosphate acyltransferase n=1 Tax=Fluctibacter corallii TaxID=2984329 RepID=A0ABT3A6F9_9ALTE|nr:phosphate acyltransferase PlsX [Aestuariibacter sp. AA17]MCV2884279.1 phosphate acyltransferase PlsX [Aestuariibacter sp. AA17]